MTRINAKVASKVFNNIELAEPPSPEPGAVVVSTDAADVVAIA